MKKIIFLITIFLISEKWVQAQDIILPKDSITGKVTYAGVVKIDSTTADQLYTKSRIWIAETFKDAQEVIQMDDKTAHIIIGKGTAKAYIMGLGTTDAGWFHYTVKVECKEGRYKYTITDFVYVPSYIEVIQMTPPPCSAEVYASVKQPNKEMIFMMKQMNDIATGLIKTLKSTMEKAQTVNSKSENW